jgi:hypothetical protein
MRTKNAKRLWPVPVTLGVMALAALLAFGLMATTGAQPAAAQDDDPCITVTAGDELIGSQEPTIPTNSNNADGNQGCNSATTPAVVKLVGRDDTADTAVSNFVIYGPGIGGANTNVYPPGTLYGDHDSNTDTDDIFYTGTGANAVKASPLPGMALQVGPGTVNLSGTTVGSSKTFTVAGTAPKTVTVYVAQGTGFTDSIADAPETNGAASVDLNDGRIQEVSIIFLGPPAIGKDLAGDFNMGLDDAVVPQCIVQDDARERLVAEGDGCAAGAPTGTTWTVLAENPDATESRSKLVVRTGLANATATEGTPIINGKSKTHELTAADQRDVTIYALVEDAEGKPLLGQDVAFRTTTTPSGIVAAGRLSDDVDTKAVIVENAADATRNQIFVDGLEIDDTPEGALIVADDAVASYTFESLPTTPFNVTVEVMVGNLSLGTVEIVRTGTPTKVVAGVFNIECFDPGGTATDPTYTDAKFDDSNDDCDASGMANRFGHGQMVVVKAHHEDALDLVVGDGDDLSTKLANEDDDLLGDGDIVTIDEPVADKDMPKAWIYSVHKDATLGEHMITVSTSATDKDGEDIADVTVSITVAGPPHRYGVEGPMYIPLGGRGTFTVTAMDKAMDLPHFTTEGNDPNDTVGVFVADVPAGNVRGLNRAGDLELDTATGMGAFTLYAPRDASQGEVARIFVSEGDSEVALTVMFGGEPMMPGMPGMPMNVMAEATSDTEITVSWDAVMDATSYMVERGYMGADNMKMWMTVAEMTMDTMYMDSGLMAETTYYYRVTAMNDAGSGDASDGMAMAMTMAEDMPPDGEMLTSPSGVDAASLPGTGAVSVSWTPGQNATQHWVVLFSLPGYDVGGRVEVLNDPDANFQVFRNVPAGEYEVVVASYDPDMGFQYQDGIGMVTVE